MMMSPDIAAPTTSKQYIGCAAKLADCSDLSKLSSKSSRALVHRVLHDGSVLVQVMLGLHIPKTAINERELTSR